MAQSEAETKLLRMLHYGCEDPVYIPGCRLQKSFYEEQKVQELQNLIDSLDQNVLFDIIRKVLKENTTLYPESFLYVLAQCARNESMRPEALRIAEEMCTTPEYFLLFFKFAKGLSPQIGTGRACRRFISNWYLKKNSLELAEMVGQTPSFRGWRHSDIIKIGHVKSTDPATAAVLTYLTRGVKMMEKNFGEIPKAKEIVSYLKSVDFFRKDVNESNVVRTIDSYLLTVHHLNFIHLKSKKVWIALLRRMPVDTLLDYIHLLSKYRMFRRGRQWDQEFMSAVCDVLTNLNSMSKTRLQPSRVYIDLCTYQLAPKYKLEIAAKKLKRFPQKSPAVSYELVRNMETLIANSFRNVEPTGLRYLIAVDNIDLQRKRCHYLPYMMSSQAAAAIAATFFASELHCEIVKMHPLVTPLYFDKKNVRINDFEVKFTEKGVLGRTNSLAVIKWAIEQKKEVDVFILIGSCIKYLSIPAKLAQLRSKLPVQNFKLVICCLNGVNKQVYLQDNNILTVVGFDDKVCKIISHFAKGVF